VDQLDLKNTLLTIFSPFDVLFNLVFFFVPSFLRTFSASLLTFTLGALLSATNRKSLKALKGAMYTFFFLYSISDLFINYNIDLTALDYTSIMLSIIAPIVMIIEGKRIINKRIKGYKIFNTVTLWVAYVVICIIYNIFYPGEVLLLFVVLYVFFSFFFKYIFIKIIKRGFE